MKFNLVKHNPLSHYLADVYFRFISRNVESYIFVATTGRSGSNSLTNIFSAVDGGACFHEPHPIMVNDCPPHIPAEEYFRKVFKIKNACIRRSVKDGKYYVETNHQFIKRFSAYATESFGDKLKVIHLVRDPVSVATSFYRINSIPGESRLGLLYLLDPKSSDCILNISDVLYGDSKFSHDIFKCLWYWYEIEARTKRFKKDFPDIPVFDLQTNDLNNFEKLCSMFDSFNIIYDKEKLNGLVGTKSNQKKNEKSKKIDLTETRVMHEKLLAILKDRFDESEWI